MNKELDEALEIVNSYDEHDKIEDFDVVSRNSLYYYQIDVDCMDTLKEALIKSKEMKKTLDILKEKKINIEQFYLNFIKSGFGYHYYLEKWYKFQSTDSKKLTEEEFDLLKRWLND